VALTSGVLIIGSLLWEKDRQGWRDARLDMNRSEMVSAADSLWTPVGSAARPYLHDGIFPQCASWSRTGRRVFTCHCVGPKISLLRR
jgi:hypothetical protein